MTQNPRGWLYLDNNVLSKAAEYNDTRSFKLLAEKGLPPAYSATTISDMLGSTRIDERIGFLDRIGALRTELNTENDLGATLIDERASSFYERFVGGVDTTRFEESLYLLVQVAHTGNFGDPYTHPLKGVLSSMTGLLTNLSDDVPHEFRHVLDEARNALIAEVKGYETITESPEDISMRETVKTYAAGVQPPGVIAKIEQKFPGSFPPEFLPQPGERNHAIILQTAVTLSAMGYGTDKRLRKRDDAEALKGAESTLRDAQHIAHSFFAGALICNDKGMRKITKAIAEYMQIDFPILSYLPDPQQ